MAKDKERRGSKRSSPGSSREPKAPNIIPSRVWGEGARFLWRALDFKEKALIVMGIFVPALDQIARLASIGVTMKAISSGVRQHPDLETRLWLGALILAASAISGLVVMASNRVTRNLKIFVTRLVRRIHGRIMANTSGTPLSRRDAEIASLVSKERDFVSSATSGFLDLIDFVAAVSIVIVLLIALTWFNWLVGAILMLAGFVALLLLKFKVRTASPKEGVDSLEARKKLTEQFERIADGGEDTRVQIDRYANNDFDRIAFAELEAKTRLQKKITSVMGFGSAILMAVVYLLVSAEGAFDEKKMVWLVVFVFGLRMVVTQGKHAMVSWGGVLGEKETLMELAKASIITPQQEVGGEPKKNVNGSVDEESPLTGVAGTKIVECSFRGLRRTEIVSREPLVIEMTVESDVEIEGFYWSFSIYPLESSFVLISKTSEDCGITWTLPKGRSKFRMVSGPVWLPSGTYSARVGAAQGNRLLDLAGSTSSKLSICVLPDESASRSTQTRLASDVVILDVNWDLEFHGLDAKTVDSGLTSAIEQ